MREGFSLYGHPQRRHPRPIRLQYFPRLMHLLQRQQLLLVQRPPPAHPPLKGAQLAFLIPARMLLAQPPKQRFRFQPRRLFQHRLHLGPVLGKGVRMRPVCPRLLQFARQLPEPLVLSYRLAAAYIGLGCRLFLGFACSAFSHNDPHLGVGDRHGHYSFLSSSLHDFPATLMVGISNCHQ